MNKKSLLEEIKRCILEEDIIRGDVLKQFLLYETNKNLLENSISKIKLNNRKTNDNFLGSYNFGTKELRINHLHYIRETKMKTIDNINLIDCCYHELTHASQLQLLKNISILNAMPTFYINFMKTITSMETDYNKYLDNHSQYIYEYQAIIVSKFKTCELLDKMGLYDICSNMNRFLASEIIKFYEDGCPLKKSRKIVNSDDMFLTPDVDEYYKLIFGYDLSDKTFYNLENIANNKVKVINMTRYIQK